MKFELLKAFRKSSFFYLSDGEGKSISLILTEVDKGACCLIAAGSHSVTLREVSQRTEPKRGGGWSSENCKNLDHIVPEG